MDGNGVSRRAALCLLGTGLTLAAGCSSSEETEGDGNGSTETGAEGENLDGEGDPAIETGDLPAFTQALAATPDENYFFGAVDLETMWTVFDGDGDRRFEGDEDESESGETPTDPLVVNPLSAALIGYVVLLGLGFSAAGSVYERNDRAGGEGYVVFANDTNIVVSDYDFDGIVADMGELDYEEVLLEDDRAVYYDASTGQAVGATESLFVYAHESENGDEDEFDPIAAVERHVDAAVGERPLEHETDDDFEWLLRAGDTTGLVFCLFSDADELAADATDLDEDEFESTEGGDSGTDLDVDDQPYEGAKGGLQHLDIVTDESRPFASAVFTYASEDRIDEERLEDAVGTQAEAGSTTVVRDGARVRVEATYAEETLEE
ncbi:hypothetical protein [Natronoglomus mannanivorans]|uniref:Uncharacterized protein n=1 Tax=Natronoglomus mannanivorans TaxID=2979990 RepID=A0AAP3E0K8_9EURY|nr:hypothetical protein [Halobacteria archaeon AArc-xg1-1]